MYGRKDPDVKLDIDPGQVEVEQDGKATVKINFKFYGSFNDPVKLSVSGLPEDVNYSFASPSPQESILTLTAGKRIGIFNVIVSGSSGAITRHASFLLKIKPKTTIRSCETDCSSIDNEQNTSLNYQAPSKPNETMSGPESEIAGCDSSPKIEEGGGNIGGKETGFQTMQQLISSATGALLICALALTPMAGYATIKIAEKKREKSERKEKRLDNSVWDSLIIEGCKTVYLDSSGSVSAKDLDLSGKGKIYFKKLSRGLWTIRPVNAEAKLNGLPLKTGKPRLVLNGDIVEVWGGTLRLWLPD